jgi:hypothetical protein
MSRVGILGLSVVLAFCPLVALAEPTRAQHDPPVSITPGSAEWVDMGLDAVALIEITEERYSSCCGSGALVGRCHVVTARHVPFPDWETLRQKDGITVRLGYTGDPSTPWKLVTSARVVAWGGGSGRTLKDCMASGDCEDRDDWALVELDRCVDTIAPIKMARPNSDQIWQHRVVPLGFPNNARNQSGKVTLMADNSCTMDGWAGALPVTTCAVADGQSGGPVLTQGESGTWYIVGVNTMLMDFGDGDEGGAYVDFREPWDTIQSLLSPATKAPSP